MPRSCRPECSNIKHWQAGRLIPALRFLALDASILKVSIELVWRHRLAMLQSLQGNTYMATGTVKWFNSTKGFGFIQPDDGGQDVFVHISAVERAGLSTLVDSQKINYEIEQDRRTGKSSAGNLSKAG